MRQAELERTLILESHRLVAEAAAHAVQKLGKPVPAEARADYLSDDEIAHLRERSSGSISFDDPIFEKAMAASTAQIDALSYPLDGQITSDDADALASLQLTPSQASVTERVIAEACHSALFHFFCLLDSVGDPEISNVKDWHGARLTSPREEGTMLHDEFVDTFHEYRKLTKEDGY
jgi:hypothetical protein